MGIPLVITEVKGERVVDTQRGEATAVVIDVLLLDYSGFEGDDDRTPELIHKPDVLIFWSVVQKQLLSDDFVPPVAGRFEQKGKAYTLEPLSDDEMTVVSGLL